MVTLKTAHKIALARSICSVVLAFRRLRGLPERAVVKRNGIWWQLDLREGIDFSIYLLGGFEPGTIKLYSRLVKPGDTVLDIGANVGAHTLPLAKLVGAEGRVIAFEPTQYALGKLQANIQHNEHLAGRISVCHAMLVSGSSEAPARQVYSSWPLFERGGGLHPEHKGRLMDAEGAAALVLDQWRAETRAGKVDLIKLDVDGHEASVLAGAKETLRGDAPVLVMELAPYLYDATRQEFESMVRMLAEAGYSMRDAGHGRALPLDAARLRAIIPTGATRNVILRRP
jgi:FkbM family methyltransferase